MGNALRFLHSADWQLGLRVRFIPGDSGAVVRDARLKTVARIGEVAREREAEFVLVAGDVFEHHGLKPSTLRKTFDAKANEILKHANVPPTFALIQRINLGVFSLLARLEATNNWRAISEELWTWTDAPPRTPMGEEETAWLATRST